MAVPELIVDRDRLIELIRQGNTPEQIAEMFRVDGGTVRDMIRRLEQNGRRLEWAEVIRDLDLLQEVQLEVDGKRYLLRSETKGTAGKVFQACGVALPAVLRPC